MDFNYRDIELLLDLLEIRYWGANLIVEILYILLTIAVAVFTYAIPCYMLMLRGRKTGLTSDWQAFVPFAKEYYTIKMVKGEPVWKMLFFGWCVPACIAVILLVSLLFGTASLVVAVLLLIGYAVAATIFRVKFFAKLYSGFGYNKFMGAIAAFSLLLSLTLITEIVNTIISLDKRIKYSGSDTPSPSPSAIAKITGIKGQYAGQTFDLSDGKEIVMGRNAEICNLIFDQFQTYVSHRHCGIRYIKESDRYSVTCFSSTNAVIYDNDKKIKTNETVSLPRGTIIALGTKDNQFRLS